MPIHSTSCWELVFWDLTLYETQVTEDFGTAAGPVQAVEMDAGNTVIQKTPAQVGTDLHSQLPHSLVVVAVGLHPPYEGIRQAASRTGA